MRSLTLPTRNLAAQRTFYGQVLGLPVEIGETNSLSVHIGTSRLIFEQGDGADGFSHIAFDIPRTLLAQAEDWLRARVPLLADPQGRTVFGPTDSWNTTNLYFDDPPGNILEFIARHDQPHDGSGPFGPRSLPHISELGVVVPDVPQAVVGLGQRFGLHAFNGQSETFTAVGGHDGMLIVVREGRGWFPVGRPAVPTPFELSFADGQGTRFLRHTDLEPR
ncbi:hypothetical protein CVO96_01700 [Deinococcus koreensis]|uniref:VOC domain-containing protein n=1 Tax=Deinococcus koreensis TaxID=2054903 RepID=A0A2K3V1Y9_9DEIO|nr:hypothetical protein CVO96_01700 [Deinococcus koreensis]